MRPRSLGDLHDTARDRSVVASIGYCAFLGGPLLIGYLGQHVRVLRALLEVAAVLAVAMLISGALRPLPAESSSHLEPTS